MCGIYGILGPGIVQQDLKIFEELGMVSLLRGTDGAGMFTVPSKITGGKVKVIKTSQDFLALMIQLENVSDVDKDGKKKEEVRDKKHFLQVAHQGIIGHNRAATIGATSNSGAHPFYSKDMKIIGCHNGTITDHTVYGKSVLDRVDGKNYHTDSQVLIDDMSKHGVKVLSNLDDSRDAYSITWMDMDTKTVNYVKNSKRSMCIAVHDRRKVVYLCSEKALLEAVLNRNNVDATYWIPNERHVFRFDCSYNGNISKSKGGNMDWNSFKLPAPDFKVNPKPPQQQQQSYVGIPWNEDPDNVQLPAIWRPNMNQNLH
jgi:glutamine phosphoribosylpyrophosphate amidotransferase